VARKRKTNITSQEMKSVTLLILLATTLYAADGPKTREAHSKAAQRYVKLEKELFLEVVETKPVQGWPNQYRTTGRLYAEDPTILTKGTRKAGECEVITEEKEGRIVISDLTMKQ